MSIQKTIIIGDVHGCYKELQELLNTLAPSSQDLIFFVGDLINKGPDSHLVVKEIMRNQYRSILGNHEWSYLKRLKYYQENGKHFSNSKHYQFIELIENFKEEENHWIANLPFYIKEKDFLLVHAGLIPNRSLLEHSPQELLYIREINACPWHDFYQEDELIVYGHWALQGLMIKKNSIGIDSGCVYGGHLSALVLPERKIVQVASQTSIL